jgi:hypothetical protein
MRSNAAATQAAILCPLGIAADFLVDSRDEVTRRGKQPGTALYWALKEGRLVHG